MKYVCVKQHDVTDCAAACLATICRQDKLKVSIGSIREAAGTDRRGTTIKGLINAAEKLGYKANGYKGDRRALTSDIETPCIAHVMVDDGLLHFVVIQEIKDEKIIIADPAVGIVQLTIDEFMGEKKSNKNRHFYKWTGVLISIKRVSDKVSITSNGNGIKRIFQILLDSKGIIAFVFLTSICFTIAGIGSSFFLKEIIDDIIPNRLYRSLTAVSIGVIILNLFRVLLYTFRKQLLIKLSIKVDESLAFGYIKHVMRLPMSFFENRKSGEILSRFTDVGKIRDALIEASVTIMVDTVLVSIGAVILYFQDSNLFFVCIIVVAIYALIVFCFNELFRNLNEEAMENSAILTSQIVESLNGIITIKSFTSEKYTIEKSNDNFNRYLKGVTRLNYVTNCQDALKEITRLVGECVIIWMGAIRVLQGETSIGTVLTFSALMTFFMDPLRNIIDLQPRVQTAIVAAERLNEIMELRQEDCDKSDELDTIGNDILIKDIHFGYGFRKEVLSGVDMRISHGQHIAFVGDSGSGKTTLAKLILGFYEVKSGEISIGGINISDISKEKLREKITYIPQETFLFSGSVFDNIVAGKENATIEEVQNAAKIAMAHDFICGLPYGYDTYIEENGMNLSGGQKQRIAVARALLRKPQIIILDEATSNLDALTEKDMTESLSEYAKDITIIFIAHRLSLVRKCDKIYVFESGKVVESGKHRELYELNGKYSKLAKIQYIS